MRKTIYYADETEDFSGTKIDQKPLPADHKYFHGPIWNALSWLIYYLIAAPVAFLIQKVWYREKVIGKEKLRPYKKQGFFLYGNHTRLMGDVFCPPMICYPKKVHIIANPDSVWPNNGRVGFCAGAGARFVANILKEMKIDIELVYLGKPYPMIFEYAGDFLKKKFNLPDLQNSH